MADSESDQFEWVSAKAQCTAGLMFERLRAGVKQDVERRNALLVIGDEFWFEFSEDAEGFEVARLQGSRMAQQGATAVVRFERPGLASIGTQLGKPRG